MTVVRFLDAGGGVSEVDAPTGARLLDVAQGDGQPLEGTCGGEMACATCHVVIAPPDFARVPPASAEEEDLLDLVRGAVRTSRLACQVTVAAEWESLTVTVPG